MGFEYKIIAKFTDTQIKDIADVLLQDNHFDKKQNAGGKEFWEFRRPENQGQLPDLTIAFEIDGLYVCQYGSTYLWTDLDKLKDYLATEDIEHKILDYDA